MKFMIAKLIFNMSNFHWMNDWNEISEKRFLVHRWGLGVGDLSGGQLFLLRPPLPAFPPTLQKVWSFYTVPV